jgi:hypothetical protein
VELSLNLVLTSGHGSLVPDPYDTSGPAAIRK